LSFRVLLPILWTNNTSTLLRISFTWHSLFSCNSRRPEHVTTCLSFTYVRGIMCNNLAISCAGYSPSNKWCPLQSLESVRQVVSTEAAAGGIGCPTLQRDSQWGRKLYYTQCLTAGPGTVLPTSVVESPAGVASLTAASFHFHVTKQMTRFGARQVFPMPHPSIFCTLSATSIILYTHAIIWIRYVLTT